MSTLVIDYGMSNLGSICRALEECGANAFVSDDPRSIESADHLILPGAAAFPDGMSNLNSAGWVKPIKQAVAAGVPLLGICLGMQLLADKSYENGESAGLGLIPGQVCLFTPKTARDKVPHVGWNEIYKEKENVLLENIPEQTDFYFVHSYHFMPENTGNIIAKTDYCGGFVSIVADKNIFGVQFHPEKSGKLGFQILKNFLDFYKVGN